LVDGVKKKIIDSASKLISLCIYILEKVWMNIIGMGEEAHKILVMKAKESVLNCMYFYKEIFFNFLGGEKERKKWYLCIVC